MKYKAEAREEIKHGSITLIYLFILLINEFDRMNGVFILNHSILTL